MYTAQKNPLYLITKGAEKTYVFRKADLATVIEDMITAVPDTVTVEVVGKRPRVNKDKEADMTYHIANKIWSYNKTTGELRWNKGYGQGKNGTGLQIRYCTVDYARARVIFLLMMKHWPILVDHIDGDRYNFKWENLREATSTEDAYNTVINNPLGKGVAFMPRHNRAGEYRACMCVKGKQTIIGFFKTPKEAAAAYEEYANRIAKEFAVHNSRNLTP